MRVLNRSGLTDRQLNALLRLAARAAGLALRGVFVIVDGRPGESHVDLASGAVILGVGTAMERQTAPQAARALLDVAAHEFKHLADWRRGLPFELSGAWSERIEEKRANGVVENLPKLLSEADTRRADALLAKLAVEIGRQQALLTRAGVIARRIS